MSFNVNDFGTNRMPICDFLLVNTTNLCARCYLALFASYRGVLVKLWLFIWCLYLTPSFRMNPQTMDCEICLKD